MTFRLKVPLAFAVLCATTFLSARAQQDTAHMPFMNPQLAPEERATDLVHRMTLAEKASEMQNNSAAVPRLQHSGLPVVE